MSSPDVPSRGDSSSPVAGSPEIACANCGRRFVGTFCPDCGQEAAEPRRPIGDLVHELLGTFFAFDARAWRTLGPLLARPGFLTVEWFAGRRARYVPPLRLYVFAAVAFFAVMAATGGGPLRIAVISSENGTVLTFGGGKGRVYLGFSESREREEPPSAFDRWMDAGAARVREHPEDFNRAVFATLSNVHFLILPIAAFLMKLFWRRRYYIEHLVFAMHFQSFMLLLGAALVAAVMAVGDSGPVSAIVRALWVPMVVGYLFLALRRFYGGRWWATALKVVAFGWLYVMLAVAVVDVVAIATMAVF